MRRFYQIEKGWIESGHLAANFGWGLHWGGEAFADIEVTWYASGELLRS